MFDSLTRKNKVILGSVLLISVVFLASTQAFIHIYNAKAYLESLGYITSKDAAICEIVSFVSSAISWIVIGISSIWFIISSLITNNDKLSKLRLLYYLSFLSLSIFINLIMKFIPTLFYGAPLLHYLIVISILVIAFIIQFILVILIKREKSQRTLPVKAE